MNQLAFPQYSPAFAPPNRSSLAPYPSSQTSNFTQQNGDERQALQRRNPGLFVNSTLPKEKNSRGAQLALAAAAAAVS
eukprot:CAMPEP_0184365012 /NCGR_PEP_ID=MMETSP1089-20130417/146880_1 /TAXON_ID=38269 ORGANISM="Gloeochaete wittrockiana, Strain SAG46.84" /NCGR_SAMPLE_ID=MMETSP1089 /ASSEMBLY_ACC=CAM_ASM_000445 /LENGTH=77 /DNA_ID=CAMNT_0026706093 /DNA_START=26 /DNA_END=256 /DNA_ORIENTATION=+